MSRTEKNQTLEELTNREVTKETLDALVEKNARAFQAYIDGIWAESILSSEIKKLQTDPAKSLEVAERGKNLTEIMQGNDRARMEYQETMKQLREAFSKMGKTLIDDLDDPEATH